MYQQEVEQRQLIKAGAVVVTYVGVKLGHGATKNSWIEHTAITAGTPAGLEPVDDETYNKR